ncbi:flagellin family protein [Defluviimonas sp. 20V17]|uniref:Flagellin n=1 Tax=Allgaiera indica TaxID=765699 RepID=A0AAN4UPD4_9RHOB|nr:flagellin [Allgaiera indica]KDB03894.1 flagellin family protein [Defluviimonas sp. 20V17]GHD99259.1 flagellin [Allgaiera indica]SDW30378.1 flagellin [Allgaiera indica]
MSSILTNSAAMTALQTLKQVNQGLQQTQDRISTGLKIQSAKDNASYFAISQQMKGDSGMYKSINESLTMTKNSVSTASLGASTVNDLTQQFVQQVSFAQGSSVDHVKVQATLDSLVSQIKTTISQATFNGNDLVNSNSAVTVVTGVSRAGGTFATTTMTFNKVNLASIASTLGTIKIGSANVTASTLSAALTTAQTQLTSAINAATTMGVAETSLTTQQDFLSKLTNKLDAGVGSMVDANMEQEAAKLQSYQVQQQLATQSLSIANKAPQNILSLFR